MQTSFSPTIIIYSMDPSFNDVQNLWYRHSWSNFHSDEAVWADVLRAVDGPCLRSGRSFGTICAEGTFCQCPVVSLGTSVVLV